MKLANKIIKFFLACRLKYQLSSSFFSFLKALINNQAQTPDNRFLHFPPQAKIIAQKVDYGINLNSEELQYLCASAHSAYLEQIYNREIVSSQYLLDVLEAFAQLLSAAKGKINYEINYFMANLPNNEGFNQNLTNKQALYELLEKNKRIIKKGAYIETAEVIARNLNILVRDCEAYHLTAKQLNKLLQPFFRSLIILTKKYEYLKSSQPSFHYVDKILFNYQTFVKLTSSAAHQEAYIKRLDNKFFSLSINHDFEFLGNIGIKAPGLGERMSFSFNFPEVNDLLRVMLLKKDLNHLERIRGEYFSLEQFKENNIYSLNYGNVRINFITEEFHYFQHLLEQFADTYKEAFSVLSYQWGDC